MPFVEVTMPVLCDRREIYPILKRMDKYPEFMEDLVSVAVLERKDNTTVTSWVSNVDGRTIKWTELDTFDDDKLFITYRQLDGDLKKMEGAWELTEIAGGTEVKLTVDFEFGIPMIAGLLNPILKKKVRDNSMNMLRAIKQKIENG
ncbi:SRPBCC family protein|uniref:Ribosome association toxin PasT (RatA) of the RatAB toxin-antitoxin module n=1 Tax=Dendrosporobacter quercicolus TaxID=146817 RepID=A0A1G9L6M4_9FIRM|nr:SRPBCC family protein [Dendrosporobacter quercicolus]NSL46612.1 SRPBCC family protein [Dendrosporobacter quercicolus DSM 1736]SDL57393.1 Ribosome association toxin PasT (RatA) of the RatAB toxin-antitoxin module [Dendrosporobacter quercicolus]